MIVAKPILSPQPKGVCVVEWCDRPVRTAPHCLAHYQRKLRGVDMDKPLKKLDWESDVCSVADCDSPRKALGLCGAHWWRQKNGVQLDTPVRVVDPTRACAVDGCPREYTAKGYCSLHYARSSGYVNRELTDPDNYGEVATYAASHVRIFALWGSAKNYSCVLCEQTACQWAYDGTDPDQQYGQGSGKSFMHYSIYPEFYMPMCSVCHLRRDKRLAAAELREYREWKHRTGLTLKDLETVS